MTFILFVSIPPSRLRYCPFLSIRFLCPVGLVACYPSFFCFSLRFFFLFCFLVFWFCFLSYLSPFFFPYVLRISTPMPARGHCESSYFKGVAVPGSPRGMVARHRLAYAPLGLHGVHSPSLTVRTCTRVALASVWYVRENVGADFSGAVWSSRHRPHPSFNPS